MRRRLFASFMLSIGVTSLVLVAQDFVDAQDATPSHAGTACTVPPRDAAFVEKIQGTPVVPDSRREPVIDAFRTSSQAASVEDVAALQETLDLFTACTNAGDFARTSSLFSNGYWRREVGDLSARAEEFQSEVAATPLPLPAAQQIGAAFVIEPRYLPDGRLAALVLFVPPQPTDNGIDLVVFAKVADRWLIDEVVTDAASDLASPTPGD